MAGSITKSMIATMLEERLRQAAQRKARHRIARTLTQPARMIVPQLAQATHRALDVEARTFWGETLHVTIPEAVSTSIWRYGFFEEDVCRLMMRVLRPGMTFVDVGAHLGFFTRFGAFLTGETGHVLALEPTSYMFERLQRNVAGRASIEPVSYAAFSRETELKFLDFGIANAAYNSAFGFRDAAGSEQRREAREIRVPAKRLDDVILQYPRVDLIKIDAESSEMHVLEGLQQTLVKHRPALILEVGDFDVAGAAATSEIIEWLRQRDYTPLQLRDGQLVAPDMQERFAYANLLFVRGDAFAAGGATSQ